MLKEAAKSTFIALTSEQKKDTNGAIEPVLNVETLLLPGIKKFGISQPDQTLVVTKEMLKEQIDRTVKEVFKGKVKTLRDYFKPYLPSTASNIECSRNKGGSIGSFYMDFREEWLKQEKEESRNVIVHDNITYNQVRKKYFGRSDSGINTGLVSCDLYGFKSGFYGDLGREEDELLQWQRDFSREEGRPSNLLLVDPTELEHLYWDDYLFWFEKAFYDVTHDRNFAEIVVLAEPLKTRSITKSSPQVQFCLKPIQKWMHTTLRQLRVTQLIGTPLTPEYINELFETLPEGNCIVSGDYKAATDNLKSWASEEVGDSLFRIIAEEFEEDGSLPSKFISRLKTIFISSLTRHVFLDPEGGPQRHQTNGQLMGEISSFPVLCLVNMAICRFAKEKAEEKLYLIKPRKGFHKDSVMKLGINGDDCIFDGPIGRIRPIWESFAKMVGLESSIGKTYFSRKYCTVNSRVFFREDDNLPWREIPFINFGLLYGKKKSVVIQDNKKLTKKNGKPIEDTIPVHKMGQFLRDLKRTCPNFLWKKVKSRFIYYNMNKLEKTYLSWFLPEWCGGLGLPNDGELSDQDRCIATIIKANYSKFKPVTMTDAPEWLMHQLVLKELPKNMETLHEEFEYRGQRYNTEAMWTKVYSYFTYSLLYSKEQEALTNEVDPERSIKKAIRHNEQILKKAQKQLSDLNVRPMQDSDLNTEVKKTFIPCLVTKEIPSSRGYLPRWI
jgi:hypothetical protein